MFRKVSLATVFPIFSNDVFGPRCVKLSWVQKIDQRLTTRQGKEKRLDEGDDIGLDTYSTAMEIRLHMVTK